MPNAQRRSVSISALCKSRSSRANAIYEECWQQIRRARYTLPAPETINFFVEPSEGHDDFLTSLALCAQALEAMIQPAAGQKIAARPLYPGESRY